jgi:hypothetical protein
LPYAALGAGPVEQHSRVRDGIAQRLRGLSNFDCDSGADRIQLAEGQGGRVRQY